MNAHARNVSALGKPLGFPSFSAIDRLPNAVARRDVTANGDLSAPHVNHVWVALCDFNGADAAAKIAVRNIFPGVSGVVTLPDTSSGAPEVVGVGLTRNSGHGR